MSQALALFVLGLQLYIAAITAPLPADVRARAIELSNVATTTAAAMMSTPAPVQVGTGSAGINNSSTSTMNIDVGVSAQTSASVSVAPAQDQQPEPAAPFERSGSVSAVLASQTSLIPISGGRVVVATLRITNGTNETVRFSQSGNINGRMAIAANTLAPWSPVFAATFRNVDLSDDHQGLAPGETGDVQIISANVPASAGSFSIEITGFRIVGLTSGDMIDLSGFPISLGTIETK